jgi:hypothetical protein
MVQEMATQLGGNIAIDSRVGYGTSVSILLPRAAEEVSAAPRGSGRILVVEDEYPMPYASNPS